MSAPSSTETGPGLRRLNGLPRPDLVKQLLACLDVQRWATEIADRRPYGDAAELYETADAAAADLTEAEIGAALAAHPRIGERSTGNDTPSSWSRSEQSGVDADDTVLAVELHEANKAYEERFGHVYLVCASGRSGRELLDILTSRLDNDTETEKAVVAGELRKIARLRLARVIEA